MAPSRGEHRVCEQCHKHKRPATAISGTTLVQSDASSRPSEQPKKTKRHSKRKVESNQAYAQFYNARDVIKHECSPYCCDAKTYYLHEKYWGRVEKVKATGNDHIHECLRQVPVKQQLSGTWTTFATLKIFWLVMAHPRGKEPVKRRSGLIVV